jgi:hypothetical protein
MAKKKMNKQAKEILKLAEEKGVKNNFFFTTTFDRYLVLLDMLDEFKKSMDDDGLTVKKEYVKGRKNLYSSPAVKNFNSTTDLANRTVATLIKVIKSFSESESEDTQDPLLSMINGDGDEK